MNITEKILIASAISLGAFIIGAITFRLFRILFQKRNSDYSTLLDRKFKYTFASVLAAITFLICINVFKLGDFEYSEYFYQGLHIFSIIIVSVFFIKVSEFVKDLLFLRHSIDHEDNLEDRKFRTQLSFIHRVVTIFIVLIGLSLALMTFEGVRKIGTSILASAGIATIIIGLAAQKSISNLLAGFQVAFTQPIRIDDVVIVEGEWGKIEEISLTYVVVNIWDQRRLIVPISYFLEKPFQNWTRNSADLLGTVFLYLDYTIPIANIREKLDELLLDHPKWDKRAKAVQVTNSNEKGIEVRLLMSAANASDAFDLRCEVREKMIEYIQKEFGNGFVKQRIDIENNHDTGSKTNVDK